MSWKVDLGIEIEAARIRNGLTQQQLAQRLSITRNQLRNYEKGRCAVPVNVLAEIAAALNVDSFTIAGYQLVPSAKPKCPVLVGGLQMRINYEIQPNQKEATFEIAELKSSGDLAISAQFKIPRSA